VKKQPLAIVDVLDQVFISSKTLTTSLPIGFWDAAVLGSCL